MSPASTPPTLPAPERERWQPLRCGLVELYHYEVEEFAFRDGHLLLRGNNGTGKSKVLSLTLPFLLDANLSSARVEPDGDRHKRMEWNLLMNGRYDRRVGYAWVELGRRDRAGAEHVLTLGCGLRAVAGRAGVEPWFFLTDQRIGRDLWLATPERVALSKDRLAEAIGARGQVFKTAQDYRRAVDERLFRLGPDRYAALIDTLIQLRQPQLSKQPNEQRLSDALTEALAPLDRAALESVADAMGQLEDLRRELEELGAMREAVAAFGNRYKRYAQVAARRKARVLRQAQTEFDTASRELNAALETLERAKEKVERCRAEEQRLDEQLAAGRARLEVLHADPVMRDARRMADAREHAADSRRHAQDAEARAGKARTRLETERERAAKRRGDSEHTRAELVEARGESEAQAEAAGFAAEHARLIHAAEKPAAEKPPAPSAWADPFARGAAPETLLRATRELAQRRREQLDVVRTRLHAVGAAEQRRAEARARRDLTADALDAAVEAQKRCAEAYRTACAEAGESWRRHVAALAVLRLEDHETLLGELELWLETLEGPNPLRRALEAARERLERELAAREAALRGELETLRTEEAALREEQAQLERGEDTPPPAPYTRDRDSRAQRPGAPLWKLVDFAPGVKPSERAGLEAALEAAGLLDAWVLPDGVVIDARTEDVVLVPRAAAAASLAEWLVPSLPQDASAAPAAAAPTASTVTDPTVTASTVTTATVTTATVTAATVTAVLASIACTEREVEDAEAWVSPQGEFRIGALRGAWSKPAAAFVGHAAREAARRARLEAIAARLAEIAAATAEREAAVEHCGTTRRTAHEEQARAPSDEPLLRADAASRAAEQARRTAQTQLGEAETRLSAAEQAHAEARERLLSDARDLSLPSDAEGLARIEAALNEYRAAAAELANALRIHRRALDELDEQLLRETEAHEDAQAAAADLEEKRIALRQAEETVAALKDTVGKQVEELLGAIEQTKQSLARDQDAEKRARAELIVASSRRGEAQKDCEAKETRLAERVEARKAAVEALEAFARETELLAVALGEDFEAAAGPAAHAVPAAPAAPETPALTETAASPETSAMTPTPAVPATSALPESPWGIDAALGVARRAEQALARVAAEDSDWSRVQADVGRDLTELQNAMSVRGHSATAEPSDHGLIVRIVHQQRPERPDVLQRRIEAELAERRLLLTAREREVLEQHLEKEIAANLQRMIQDTDRRVTSINDELAARPTSTGVRYRLLWQPIPEDAQDGVPGLTEARRRLLKTSADAWSAEDRRQVGEFLQARIAAETASDDQATLYESLARALDYRRWHRFRVQRLQDGQWRPLAGPASSGERALGLTVPLFAACSSHYESADPHAPRLVLLDEAFAGIDDEARASCMALIREFDLDFVMTSEREWGCYPELPGLSICQLVRREGIDAVHVSRWTWDGIARRAAAEPVGRFPESADALGEEPAIAQEAAAGEPAP